MQKIIIKTRQIAYMKSTKFLYNLILKLDETDYSKLKTLNLYKVQLNLFFVKINIKNFW